MRIVHTLKVFVHIESYIAILTLHIYIIISTILVHIIPVSINNI